MPGINNPEWGNCFICPPLLYRSGITASDTVATLADIKNLPSFDRWNVTWAFQNALFLHVDAPLAGAYTVTVYCSPLTAEENGTELGPAVVDVHEGVSGPHWIALRDVPPGIYRVAVTSLSGLAGGESVAIRVLGTA
jgi:hypothetical protein